MKAAKYPQRMCKETVWGEHLAYYCEIVDMHPGPCASFSVQASVEARDAWEQANPDWEERIGSSNIIV